MREMRPVSGDRTCLFHKHTGATRAKCGAPALAELVGAADSGDGSGGGGRAPCPRSLALQLVRGRRRGDGDGIMAATLFSWMGGGRAS